MTKKSSTLFFSLSVFFLAIIIFVNPIGDFPLNDDWQYAYPIRSMIENGSFEMISQFAPNIFLQIIWGYLFCLTPNDFSFTILRISTLVTAFFGAYVFFQMIKTQEGRNTREKLLLTFFLVFNPLFFSLAFSFMTDVPFLTLSLTSLFFYKKYFEQDEMKFRILGIMFSIAAFFIRQPGILIWVGAEFSILIFYLLKKPKPIHTKLTINIFLGFIATLIGAFITYLFVEKGLKEGLGVSEHYRSVEEEYLDVFINNPFLFLFHFSKRSLMTVFFIGLFCFPFIALIIEKIKFYKLDKKWIFGLVLIFNLLTTFFLFRADYIFPYGGNIFFNLGVGSNLLTDSIYLNMPNGFELPNWIMISFGLLCQILGCYIFIFLFKKIYLAFLAPLENKFLLTLVFVNVIYLSVMMIFSYFDRYLLLLFSSFLIIIFRETSLKRIYQYKSFVILMIFMGWFSVSATKDYLSRNRATKTAFEYLKNQGIKSEQIDAGIPICGFEETLGEIEETHQYILSLNEIEGYEAIDDIPFYRFLFFEEDQIKILKKKPNNTQNKINRNPYGL